MSASLEQIAARATALLAIEPGQFLVESPVFSSVRPAVALRVERVAAPAVLAERLELVREELGVGWLVELHSKRGRDAFAERSQVLVISQISVQTTPSWPSGRTAVEPGRGPVSLSRAPANSPRRAS